MISSCFGKVDKFSNIIRMLSSIAIVDGFFDFINEISGYTSSDDDLYIFWIGG